MIGEAAPSFESPHKGEKAAASAEPDRERDRRGGSLRRPLCDRWGLRSPLCDREILLDICILMQSRAEEGEKMKKMNVATGIDLGSSTG